MFTGLVEDIGSIEAVEAGADGSKLRVATRLGSEIAGGDSISVDGVCLTAVDAYDGGFAAEAMNQTLRISSLGALGAGDRVNLELAMRPSGRLGGHILQGHVDGVGEVVSVEDDGFAKRLRVGLGPELIRYAVERGSIGLSGVSLTVATLGDAWVEVSLIPETLERTILGDAAGGMKLNVECDIVAKYVERLVSPFSGKEQV